MAAEFQLGLIDNALDFLNEAVERLSVKEPTASSLKYAMLNLASALELLLKQRLLKEHWTLIFADVSKASQALFSRGDFKSADFAECLDRLEKVCAVVIEKKHKDVLFRLRNEGNRVRHFHVSISKNEAVSVLVQAWSFIVDFVAVQIELSAASKVMFESILKKITEHQAFVEHRWKEISKDIEESKKSGAAIVECPTCLELAVPVSGDDTACFFCMTRYGKDELMQKWQEVFEPGYYKSPKDHMISPITFECPECAAEQLCKRPEEGWVCFSCGRDWDELRNCRECDRLFDPDDDEDICPECWDYKIHKED